MVDTSVSQSIVAIALVTAQLLCVAVDPVISTICFSGESYKNASGYWTVEATVTHKDVKERDPEFGLATGRWKYNVEVTTLDDGDKNSIQVVFKTTGPPRRVGSDYTLYPGFGYYKFHDDWVNWDTAKKVCEGEGAHLMLINSKKEVEIFKEILKKIDRGQKWVHVGFHDRFQEGKYTTVLGTPLTSSGYTEWKSGEPTGVTDENCGGAIISTGKLKDVKCSDGADYICEQELW